MAAFRGVCTGGCGWLLARYRRTCRDTSRYIYICIETYWIDPYIYVYVRIAFCRRTTRKNRSRQLQRMAKNCRSTAACSQHCSLRAQTNVQQRQEQLRVITVINKSLYYKTYVCLGVYRFYTSTRHGQQHPQTNARLHTPRTKHYHAYIHVR